MHLRVNSTCSTVGSTRGTLYHPLDGRKWHGYDRSGKPDVAQFDHVWVMLCSGNTRSYS